MIVTLEPYAWSVGDADVAEPYLVGTSVHTPPITGDVADDSDATYYELGAWFSGGGTRNTEIISCDFLLPPGPPPTAVLIYLRARTPDATLAAQPADLRQIWSVMAPVGDPTNHLIAVANGNSANPPHMAPLYETDVAEPTWFRWFYQGGPDPDLDDPTEAGNWGETDANPGLAEALTGPGLRVSLFWQSENDTLGRIAWMNAYEVRLLVARPGGAPICQGFPRSGGGGNTSPHGYPPSKARQGGAGANGYY